MSAPTVKKWAPPSASKSPSPAAVKVGGGAATLGSKDTPATPLSSAKSKWSKDKEKDKVAVVESAPLPPPQQAPATMEPVAVVAEDAKVVAAVEAPGPVGGGGSDDVVTGGVKEEDSLPTPAPVVSEPSPAPTSILEPAVVVETASPPEPLAISSPPQKGEGGGHIGEGPPPFPSSSPSTGSDATSSSPASTSTPRRETPRRRQAGPPAEDLLRHLLPGKAPPPPPPIVVSPPAGESTGSSTWAAAPPGTPSSAAAKTTLHAMAVEMAPLIPLDTVLGQPGSPLASVMTPSSPSFGVAQFHMRPYSGSGGGGGRGAMQQLEQQQQQSPVAPPSPLPTLQPPPTSLSLVVPVVTSSAVSGVMGRLATSHLASHGSKSPQAPVQDLLSRARTLLMGSPSSLALNSNSSTSSSKPQSPAFVAGEGLGGEGHRDFVPRGGVGSGMGGGSSPLSPSLAFLTPQQVEAAVNASEAASTHPSRAGSPVFGGGAGGALDIGGGVNSFLLTNGSNASTGVEKDREGGEEEEEKEEEEGDSPFAAPSSTPPPPAAVSPLSPSLLNPAVKVFIHSEPSPQGFGGEEEGGEAALADSAWQHSQGAPHSPPHYSHTSSGGHSHGHNKVLQHHAHHPSRHPNHPSHHQNHHHNTHQHSHGGGSRAAANRATLSSSSPTSPTIHPPHPFVAALVSKDFTLASSLLEGPDVPALSVGSPLALRGPHGEPLLHLAASRSTPPHLLEAIVGKVRDATFGGGAFSPSTPHHHPLGLQHDGLLPLHVALLVGAPLETIRYLLHAYPVAATVEVDRGLSPLACAIMGKAPVEVVRLILGMGGGGGEVAAADSSSSLTLEQLQQQQQQQQRAHQFKAVRMGEWYFHPLFLALRLASSPDVIATLLAAWPEAPTHSALSHPYLYPLHFAALFSPHAIAPLLLRHPEAARVTPSKPIDGVPPGLPLHLHLSSGLASVDTIVELVKAYPESASMASTLMVAFKANLPAEQVLALTRGSPTRV